MAANLIYSGYDNVRGSYVRHYSDGRVYLGSFNEIATEVCALLGVGVGREYVDEDPRALVVHNRTREILRARPSATAEEIADEMQS